MTLINKEQANKLAIKLDRRLSVNSNYPINTRKDHWEICNLVGIDIPWKQMSRIATTKKVLDLFRSASHEVLYESRADLSSRLYYVTYTSGDQIEGYVY